MNVREDRTVTIDDQSIQELVGDRLDWETGPDIDFGAWSAEIVKAWFKGSWLYMTIGDYDGDGRWVLRFSTEHGDTGSNLCSVDYLLSCVSSDDEQDDDIRDLIAILRRHADRLERAVGPPSAD